METEDEIKCQLCPCCVARTKCIEFQKILDSKDVGIQIYRHSTLVNEIVYVSNNFEATSITTNDVFILHNTNDVEITSADILPALVQNKVDCPRCQRIIDHAQRLLRNVSIIDKQDVIGVCDHCKMKEKNRSCVDCAKILKKFITSEHIRGDYEETKERLKTWLNKIRTMLKDVSSDENGTRVRSRSQTDLRFDPLRLFSREVVHVPDVEEMFGSGKLRPTSSNAELVSKFVYFKDQVSLTDMKSTKAEKTSVKVDVVKVEKSHEEAEDLELSSDQKLILESAPKTQRVEQTVSSVTVQESKAYSASAPKTQSVEQTVSSATVQKSKAYSAKGSKINEIEPETKSRLKIKSTLKQTKPSESRLRTRKYHSEDDLSTIADVDKKESKKGFTYFFPKEAKSLKKLPKTDLTSSVLIKATKDKLEEQAEKKTEARKMKAEEDVRKKRQKEEKKRAQKDKMYEEKSKKLDGEGEKKLKTLDGEQGTKLKKVKSEDNRETFEKKGTVKQKGKPGQAESTKQELIQKDIDSKIEKKTNLRDDMESKKKEESAKKSAASDKKFDQPSKEKSDKKLDLPSITKPGDDVGPKQKEESDKKIEASDKKTDHPSKEKSDKKFDFPSKTKPGNDVGPKEKEEKDKKSEASYKKSDQPSKEKSDKKSDPLSKGKDNKQKDEVDMLKKALESQKIKTKDGKDIPTKGPTKEKSKVEKLKSEKSIQRKEETIKFKDGSEKDKGSQKALRNPKEEAEMLKKALDRQTKEKEAKERLKKAQEEAEKKIYELSAKKSFAPPENIDMSGVTTSSELKTESEESALSKTKPLEIKEVKVKKPSNDDLILRLVRLKKAAAAATRKHMQKGKRLSDLVLFSPRTVIKKRPITQLNTHDICQDSELELDLESFLRKREKEEDEENADIILGNNIIKQSRVPPVKREKNKEPVLFMSTFDTLTDKARIGLSRVVFQKEISPPAPSSNPSKGGRYAQIDSDNSKGIVRYALSDRTFIEKGWTMLPTEKVVRKMNVYRMRPVHPEFDWFEHNKNKRLIPYDSGEKFAEFDDNGRGRWYYKNGRLALDYYDAEEANAQQRFVIFSSGEPDERGRSRPTTVLATFDYLGNGVVFDHGGKIRLKYNQTEGVVLDRGIGPVSHWKWHTLNDPPVLQQVMIDTHMAHKDPAIIKLGGPADDKTRPDNEEMLAIEFDNFIKEKSKKSTQKFKPFQIKMKALKINEHFSLRVLDQATVYLIFRDGSTSLKLNIGMRLDHQEIVDTDTAEVGEVSNNVERCPARTDSLAGLQHSVAFAQRCERLRTARELRLRPAEPSASADQLTAATSRPLRPPLLTAPSGSNLSAACSCKSRKPPANNVYYPTRLI